MPVPSTSGMNVPSTSTSINTASTNPTGSGTGGSSPLLSGNGEAWTSSTGHLNIGSGISIRGNNPATTTTTRSSSSTLGTSSATTIQGGSNPSASSGRQYIILKLEKAAVVRESIETEGSKGRVWLELTFSSFHSSLLNFQKRLPLESTTKVRSNLQKETSRQEEDPNLVLWSLSLLFPSPAHPCNLRDFKVYGALSLPSSDSNEDETFPSNPEFALEKGVQSQVSNNGGWIKLLRGGLRNDSIPETFSLRWKDSEEVSFSIQYIKLVPLAAHQPNYNFSVWHISLSGVNENKVVEQVCREWKEYREKMTMRLILKHLRSRGHHSAFAMLLKSSGLGISNGNENSTSTSINQAYNTSPIDRSFEHPLLTRLYDALCKRGDWDEVERCLERAARGEDGNQSENQTGSNKENLSEALQDSSPSQSSTSNPPLFSHYVHLTTPRTSWSQLLVTDADGDRPSGRGGHQIVFDQDRSIAYLFGGWDGKNDLCDLWAYHVKEKRWRCISYDTRIQNGPGPRSCHKMVFDRRTGFIYILGRYVDFEKMRETTSSTNVPTGGSRSGTPAAASTSTSNVSSSYATMAQDLSDENSAAQNARRTFLPPGPRTSSSGENREELFISGRGASSRLPSHLETAASTSRLIAQSRLNPSNQTPPNTDNSPSASARAAAASTNSSNRYRVESDFYCFSTRNERWTCLSNDTSMDGGPKQLFDHEMVIDSETQLLYVFGGRVVHHDPGRTELSGMWRYDVIQRSWTFLFDDDTASSSSSSSSRIPSRTGHSMLLDSNPGLGSGGRQLWILGGQRGDQYLASMYTYNLSTGSVREISRDYSGDGPEAGFTQRLSIDCDSREIYFFSGLTPAKKKENELKNSFWLYRIEESKWTLIYQSAASKSEIGKGQGSSSGEDSNLHPIPFGTSSSNLNSHSMMDYDDESSSFFPRSPEPRPRYAVQMVHDTKNSSFYLFGGNPMDTSTPDLRLDDFWQLDLVRPTMDEVLRKAQFKVRKQRFLEMAIQAKNSNGGGLLAMNALVYLQTQVGSCVDHSNEYESTVFRKLMTNLLQRGGGNGMGEDEEMNEDDIFNSNKNTSNLEENRTFDTTPRAQKILPFNALHHSTLSDDDDGLPEDDEDSEMLSISQTLSNPDDGSTSKNKIKRSSKADDVQKEGDPSELYSQRISLFESLLEYFNPAATQPTKLSLTDCIESSLSKRLLD